MGTPLLWWLDVFSDAKKYAVALHATTKLDQCRACMRRQHVGRNGAGIVLHTKKQLFGRTVSLPLPSPSTRAEHYYTDEVRLLLELDGGPTTL